MLCVLSGNPMRTVDTSPEMQGSNGLLMYREFLRAGKAPSRASIVLPLRIGHTWVYQTDQGKGNPTKIHLDEDQEYPEEKLILRDENQSTRV